MLIHQLQRPPNQLAAQKLRHQRPDEIGEIGIVTVRFGGGEAVIAEVEIVPLQRLTVGVKTFHHALLHRERAVLVMAAVEDHRRTLDLARGVAGMTRPDRGRRLVAHRRIVGDEGARGWRCRDEVDTEPPAHAVSDDPDPCAVNIACGQ